MSLLPEAGPTTRPAGARAAAAGALALLASGLFLAVWLGRDGALVDDAYISFRYAARWAAGAGLTWNDGVPVEGFSNPLWTLVLGALARLGLAPHLVAPWLGLMALAAAVLAAWSLGERRGLGGTARLLLAGGLALDVGLATWAGSGLETVTCALLTALWLRAALGRRGSDGPPGTFRLGVVLGLLGAALALSRPEGPVWALWGLGWLVWGAWAPGRVLAGWLAGMTPAAAYALFRWAYYGNLLPNTFFAKMEPVAARSLGQGGEDLLRWAAAHAVPLALLAAFAVRRRADGMAGGGGRGRGGARLALVLPAGWVALQAAYVLAVGGDWMGKARYMAPVLPALYLLAAEAWTRRWPARRAGSRTPVVLLLLAAHLALGWWSRDRIPDYTRVGRELGLWLRSAASPGDMVAVTAAGAIPYFSELPAYDVLGINDPAVAGRAPRHTGSWAPGHHRYDLDRLLERAPRWIVWDFGVQVNEHRLRTLRNEAGDPDRFDYRRALLARPKFRELYVIERGAPAGTQRAYTVFRRR